jgi:hypothetical protein
MQLMELLINDIGLLAQTAGTLGTKETVGGGFTVIT